MDNMGVISRDLLATESFPTSNWALRLAVHLQDETQRKPLIQICKAHPGNMDAVFSCLLCLSSCSEMLVGRCGKVQFFLSLSFLRFYLTNEIGCTIFLRFGFDTCSVYTKQGCFFSNIKGHYHDADSVWWCSLSLSCYMISEILVYPKQRFSKNIKGKWHDSLSASTLIWRNVSLVNKSLLLFTYAS